MQLDLKKYVDRLSISKVDNQTFVYDIIRKKEIVLLPEELVRQCVVHYLIEEKGVSKNLMKVERGISVNKLSRRCDIIVYNRNGEAILLVECKRPEAKINQKVFNQIAMYNMPLQVPYLMATNGNETFFCNINFKEGEFTFLDDLPSISELKNLIK